MAYEPGRIQTGVTEYTVVCAECTEEQTAHWFNVRQAEDEFKNSGWRKRRGLWLCPQCVGSEKGDTT